MRVRLRAYCQDSLRPRSCVAIHNSIPRSSDMQSSDQELKCKNDCQRRPHGELAIRLNRNPYIHCIIFMYIYIYICSKKCVYNYQTSKYKSQRTLKLFISQVTCFNSPNIFSKLTPTSRGAPPGHLLAISISCPRAAVIASTMRISSLISAWVTWAR